MYNLIQYSDNYSKTSGILWQFFTEIGKIVNFNENNATKLFNLKEKLTDQTDNNDTKIVEIMLLLKYLNNFWRTLEMPLINWEITLDLNWHENIAANNVAAQATTFPMTDTKIYVPVVTLLTQDYVKLLEQLKSGFKKTINWNNYQPQVSPERQNQYLDFLVDPSFQGVNRFFVLLFENEAQRISNKRYYLSTVETKNYSVMIDGQKTFFISQ